MNSIKADFSLLPFNTYNEYIESFITEKDKSYLQSPSAIGKLVRLGYRTTSKIYEREEFIKVRAKTLELINPKKETKMMCSFYLKGDDPGLLALAARELPNLLQRISTILFLVVRQPSGFDISGYIDYTSSLRNFGLNVRGATNWRGVFEGTTQLRPKPNHLSYYDLHSKILNYNDSENYQTMHVGQSLVFMHKGDHKMIYMDGSRDDAVIKRTMIHSPKVGTIIFYDHIVRKPV